SNLERLGFEWPGFKRPLTECGCPSRRLLCLQTRHKRQHGGVSGTEDGIRPRFQCGWMEFPCVCPGEMILEPATGAGCISNPRWYELAKSGLGERADHLLHKRLDELLVRLWRNFSDGCPCQVDCGRAHRAQTRLTERQLFI